MGRNIGALPRRDLFYAPRAFWGWFADHSLFIAVLGYYAVVLGALHMQVGSKVMLVSLAVITVIFVMAIFAHLTNGWKLIGIAAAQALLATGVARASVALGVGDISEFLLLQATMPIGLAIAWNDDRYARQEVPARELRQ